jgi:hypothetical protein
MIEVCERFNMRISEYQALPPGDRVLYNQYTLFKLEAEAKTPALKLLVPRK